jgi:penicillin-binding protein 2
MTWFHAHSVARRAETAKVVVMTVAVILGVKFFHTQVITGGQYALQSEQNRVRRVPVPAPRGLIVDRHGEVLAENVPGYSVALLASSEDSLRSLLVRLDPLLSLSPDQEDLILRSWRRSPQDPVVVRRDAPFSTVSAMEERRVAIPGLVIQSEPKRLYPGGVFAAHVLGYVSQITEQELSDGAVTDARFGALVGRDGLERVYDARLRGRDGQRFVEVDALGRTVRDHGVAPALAPQPGDTLYTTIDAGLQRYVSEVFPAGMRGAVVVLDPRSGDILALYSAPSYDPNVFIGAVDPREWQRLSADPDHPLFNRAIQAAYPPGSPWKLLVAAIAMRRGLVNLDTRMEVPCRGGFQFGDRFWRCWRTEGHGHLNLAEAIAHSCNVYFYQLALQLGLTSFLEDAALLGAGERTGIDLPHEAASFFPRSTQYYNERFGPRGWTRGVSMNLAIGQGENTQTPINVAHFYAMLSSPTGQAMAPHLVRGEGRGGAAERRLQLSSDQLVGLRQALLAVVEGGTAARSRIRELHIGGKTGTAQNAQGDDHGWFVAFAPVEAPEIVVAAVVEFGLHGSTIAPMVTSIIARHLLGPGRPGESDGRLVVPLDSVPTSVPIVPVAPRADNGPGTR